MKNKMAGLFMFFLVFLMLFSGVSLADNQQKDSENCKTLKSRISEIDGKIKRSCDDVQGLMTDLIDLWQSYYRMENQRLSVYELFNRHQWDILKEFVVTPDPNAKVEPGRFYNLFVSLKNEARETGLLIDGTPPWYDKQRRAGIQVSNAEFAFASDAGSYFYFGNAEKNEAGKADLNNKLKNIKDQWNEHKKKYDDFIQNDLDLANKELASLNDKMAKAKAKYFEKAGQLGKAAYSGEYEHCLGKMAPAAASYHVIDGTEQLFIKGKPDTVEGLPGMGLQFIAPTLLPVLAKQNIPDCPFRLNLKRDGDRARAYVEEILKLELEKQERDTIEFGITFVDEAASFVFDTTFLIVEATAPLGNAIIDVVAHPIDNTVNGAKAVVNFTEKVLDRGYLYKIKAEGGIGEAIGTALENSAGKLGNLGSQLALRAVDSERFTINPDDPPQKRFEKMLEQIDSARQVNEGLKEMAKVTGEIAMLWKGDAVIGKTAEALSLAKTAATGSKVTYEALTNAKKAEALTNQLKALKTKNPGLPIDVEGESGALGKLIKEQEEMNKQLLAYQKKSAVKPLEGKPAAAVDDAALLRDKEYQKLVQNSNDAAKQVENKIAQLKNTLLESQKNELKKIQQVALEEKAKVVSEPATKPFKGEATPVQKKVDFTATDGKPGNLNLGEQLGKGSTSTAFIDATNDSRIIRQTILGKKESIAAKMDDFGRQVLEKDVQSDTLRVAKREAVYTKPGDEIGIEKATKYEVVERVVEDAASTIKKQGGVLTQGQQMAYEQGIRDINSRGYAWTDNHPGNFAFEKLPGEDRWRVVVFDTGNIVKVTGNTVEELAQNARAMQNRVNELAKTMEGKGILEQSEIREKILGSYEKPLVDIKAMGIESTDSIGMAAGDSRIKTGEIAKMTDQELAKALQGKTSQAVSKTTAEDVTRARKKASPVPESAEADESVKQAAASAVLTNAAYRMSLYQECVKFKKLLISGYDPEKLKKMGNPCANLGN